MRARALRRNRIGFVYQFHHLLPEFTALENVDAAADDRRAHSRREAAARAQELLDYLGLGARADAPSGASFPAASSSASPSPAPSPTRRRVLLADEPTGNLDPRTADHVFATLLALVRAQRPRRARSRRIISSSPRSIDRRVTLRDGQVHELD